VIRTTAKAARRVEMTDPIFGPQFTLVPRPGVLAACMQWRDARALFVRGQEIFSEIVDTRNQFIAAVRERNKLQKIQNHAAHEISEAQRFGVLTDDRVKVIEVAEAEIEKQAGAIHALNTEIDTHKSRYATLSRELRTNFHPVLTDTELVRIDLPKVDDIVRADGVSMR
jgi:hypothetical protein